MKYFQAVSKIATIILQDADTQLDALIKVQREVAGNALPSESKINVEVAYNKMNFFDNSKNHLGWFGVIGNFLCSIVFLKKVTKILKQQDH
ncbi:MAG: hypothetical protein R2779_12045 [Crocinitomicaceae bacterium]